MDVKSLLEATGIDLIPYAVGIRKFESRPPFEPTRLNDIRNKIQKLDSKKSDEALKYSQELLEEDSERGEKADSKAYNLIGVTGISAAFITGISSLLPTDLQAISSFPLIVLVTAYLIIVISLTLTVLLASKVVLVRNYTYPDIADVFEMGTKTLKEVKTDRLTTYIYCFAKNNQIHNIKISYLIGAQLWFRNSVIIFLALAFVLIANFLNSATNNIQLPTTTPETQSTFPITQTFTSLPSTIQPMNTIEPTETQAVSPSITNSATNISITFTAVP
jgi:hypothetical protein